jgi:Family of unknown function (DUF5681)
VAGDRFDPDAWAAGEAGGVSSVSPPVPDAGNRRITGGEPPDNCAPAARDGRGRFVPGTPAGGATRFRQGSSGNPKGRPKGAFRSGSGRVAVGARAVAGLLDAQAEALTREALRQAFDGDPVMVRFCLGRSVGLRRGRPVALAMPTVAGSGDLAAAVAAVTAALADGDLTPAEALAVSRMLDGLPRLLAAAAGAPGPAPELDPHLVLLATLRRLLRAGELTGKPADDARRWLCGDDDRDIRWGGDAAEAERLPRHAAEPGAAAAGSLDSSAEAARQ